MLEITSAQNSFFKILKALTKSSGIKKHGMALVSGRKVVAEIKTQNPEIIEKVISYKGALDEFMPDTELSKELFNEIDILKTGSQLLLIKPPSLMNISKLPKNKKVVLLPLSDPSNLGAAIRTSLAFGFKDIVLLKEAAHAHHIKCIKASSGAFLKANLYLGPSINELNYSPLYYLDLKGDTLENTSMPASSFFLLGEEGLGVPESIKGQPITIDISSDVESLNANTALGVALYQFSRSK